MILLEISLLNIIVDISTIIIAVGALAVAVISLNFSRKTGRNNVRPIINTQISSKRRNSKFFEIKNYGLGTAIITKIHFEYDSNRLNNIVDHIDIPYEACQNYWHFTQTVYHIGPQESIYPVLISEKFCKEIKDKNYIDYAERFLDRINKIKIYIEYEDVYGNKIKPYIRLPKLEEDDT